jgi:hypothetical protein
MKRLWPCNLIVRLKELRRREERFTNRQARANEEQASHDKVNTAKTSELRPNYDIDVGANKYVSPRPNVQVLLQHHKPFTPADQPEQPHSGLSEPSRAQSPSFEGDLRTESCSSHATRETNLSSLKREPEKPINFSSPNDTGWKGINAELDKAIPMAFTKTYVNKSSVSQLSEKFLGWIHAFFTERFGVKDITLKKKAARKPRVHRGLARLRRQKQELTKAKKALLKAGIAQDSRAMIALSRTWRKVMKQHNRLRLAVKENLEQRQGRAAENAFKKNPAKYAEQLFKGAEQSAAPTFSKEKCQEYFGKTYRDEDRDYVYTKLEGMIRPGLPKKAFDMRPPTVDQLCRSARRKRNGAAASLDALGYVPFKKCKALIKFLHLLGIKIFGELEVADDWAQAVMALLKKGSLTEDLDIVSEFRPITMTACFGKIFLSVVSDRLQVFFVKNSYIPRKIQKGFLSGIAGCVEHSFMLFEAMKEAKEEQRQIVVSWIDLANAYGSVRHNLIQFAMEWFHVPKECPRRYRN